MRLKAEESSLLVVDIQQQLVPEIHDHERVVDCTAWLIDVAAILKIPVHATEQYPKGLGHTIPLLRSRLEEDHVHEKICFGWPDEPEALTRLTRPQVVLTGTEAHVCVMQTALALLEAGREVFVVAEAVGSRRSHDRDCALERMQQAGCWLVTREMVAFEWLQRAGTDVFREVLQRYIR
ncbi:nicotinamidase-related amidase [Alkalispirillum mobile]|uniref:Nicotinamidase-related amidase n=1 Tax=Alkalispirillum mobile TaxID=85925 RepID=A0A498C712_9GAMM|nr:hydrolase [Alkalispirillum mobile]RLK48318.1 nicotinamidase-related amidase [Alkalispirillum mobile]